MKNLVPKPLLVLLLQSIIVFQTNNNCCVTSFSCQQFRSKKEKFTLLPSSLSSRTSLLSNSKTKNIQQAELNISNTKSGDDHSTSRRALFVKGFSLLSPTVFAANAQAFPNKISDKYDDRPKRRGPQPKDLGVAIRTDIVGEEYIGLKHCGTAPNCFCSTENIEDDPDFYIPAWKWPTNTVRNKEEAFEQLLDVIKKYEPGQDNIDGGGFQIVKSDLTNGYIYVQFESLKNGYIDDFELAYIDDNNNSSKNAVQIRSSSRIGYLDYGVNSKRINYVAKKLRAMGWDAPGVDYSTHRNYAIQNDVA